MHVPIFGAEMHGPHAQNIVTNRNFRAVSQQHLHTRRVALSGGQEQGSASHSGFYVGIGEMLQEHS